jgi:DNA-3-methyladenine glycosylase II
MIVNEADISALTGRHRLFAAIHDELGPPPNWKRPEGFVSLAKIILEQQVSLASAKAHFDKLNGYLPEFTPAEMLKLSDTEMLACQVSRQKAKYLRALSDAILKKELQLKKMRTLDEADIRAQLTAVKGIGVWTSDIYLMFCLQAKDIFPVGDIAIVNTVRALTTAQTPEEIVKLSAKWKPYRSLATYFLWHHYLSRKKK